MTARTHLSIGEVLGLLTDDFPDLTITKIRFLESQGLIAPERTASGYRKFYEADIERLRWILRQQRENFLPLKVIKDRLDRSEGRTPTQEDSEEASTPAQTELDLAGDRPDDPPPVWMVDHAARETGADAAATESEAPEREPEPPTATGPVESDTSTTAPKAGIAPPVKARKHRSTKPTTPTPPGEGHVTGPSAAPTTDVSDVSMTRAEILGASGLTERQLTDLESFGMVTGDDGPGDVLYGADALVCAKQARILLDAGMEPRHLRAFKIAADREAGLYEQLLLPLLRRRDPAARSEANALAGRLMKAGAKLHGSLLRASMHGQLRGRP